MLKGVAAAAGVSMLFLTGCDLESVAVGPIQTESRSIERDKSELVRADVHLGAGELSIRGGAQKMMEGDFRYNIPEWKPQIRYNATGFRGVLTIEQPSGHKMAKDMTYEWNLRFNNDTPIDMAVHMGAGKAELDLGALSLRSVEVNIGAGEVNMDLR
jgi:hypothetical protein